jgi:hypothetical protein
MANKTKIDYNEERLNQSILKDIENGVRWSEIAEKRKVDMRYVSSVFGTYRKEKEAQEDTQGGVIRYWGGHRLTDGKPSPITKYNLNDLSPEERKRLGFA